jgi:hypothetical protein
MEDYTEPCRCLEMSVSKRVVFETLFYCAIYGRF